MASPPLRVATAFQTAGLTESFEKPTWPSQNRTFTPPGWRLRAAFQAGLWRFVGPKQSLSLLFGV